MQNKPPRPSRVNLTADAERRLQVAAAAAVGGTVLEPDQEALEALIADTVQLLCEIDAALLSPIIQDRVNGGAV